MTMTQPGRNHRFWTAKAPSPLTLQSSLRFDPAGCRRSPETVPAFSEVIGKPVTILDCGGKRSATPLLEPAWTSAHPQLHPRFRLRPGGVGYIRAKDNSNVVVVD
jgi:hypothetical protein